MADLLDVFNAAAGFAGNVIDDNTRKWQEKNNLDLENSWSQIQLSIAKQMEELRGLDPNSEDYQKKIMKGVDSAFNEKMAVNTSADYQKQLGVLKQRAVNSVNAQIAEQGFIYKRQETAAATARDIDGTVGAYQQGLVGTEDAIRRINITLDDALAKGVYNPGNIDQARYKVYENFYTDALGKKLEQISDVNEIKNKIEETRTEFGAALHGKDAEAFITAARNYETLKTNGAAAEEVEAARLSALEEHKKVGFAFPGQAEVDEEAELQTTRRIQMARFDDIKKRQADFLRLADEGNFGGPNGATETARRGLAALNDAYKTGNITADDYYTARTYFDTDILTDAQRGMNGGRSAGGGRGSPDWWDAYWKLDIERTVQMANAHELTGQEAWDRIMKGPSYADWLEATGRKGDAIDQSDWLKWQTNHYKAYGAALQKIMADDPRYKNIVVGPDALKRYVEVGMADDFKAMGWGDVNADDKKKSEEQKKKEREYKIQKLGALEDCYNTFLYTAATALTPEEIHRELTAAASGFIAEDVIERRNRKKPLFADEADYRESRLAADLATLRDTQWGAASRYPNGGFNLLGWAENGGTPEKGAFTRGVEYSGNRDIVDDVKSEQTAAVRETFPGAKDHNLIPFTEPDDEGNLGIPSVFDENTGERYVFNVMDDEIYVTRWNKAGTKALEQQRIKMPATKKTAKQKYEALPVPAEPGGDGPSDEEMKARFRRNLEMGDLGTFDSARFR